MVSEYEIGHPSKDGVNYSGPQRTSMAVSARLAIAGMNDYILQITMIIITDICDYLNYFFLVKDDS